MAQPKGFLIAIGGGENKGDEKNKKNAIVKFDENGILKSLVKLISKYGIPKIKVVTTASSLPEDLAKEYKSAFHKLEGIDAGHLKIETREDAENEKILDRIKKANCVFFTGGDQEKLCSILGGTELLQIIKNRYLSEHFFIADTSAGAAAMSHTIINGGDPAQGYKKGQIDLSIGFAFIADVIIDTHFDERGRLARLLQAIAIQPGIIGIGLSEDTGIIVDKGHRMQAIGSGTVVIIEGSELRYNNLHEIEDKAPITLSNVTLHTLSNQDKFDIASRELQPVKFREYEKK